MIGVKKQKISETLDVTSGPILAKMFRFVLPIFFSGVIQQAFTTADSVVVGRFVGSNALAGISSTGSLINLLVNFAMGLSAGAAVAISQHVGAGDKEGIKNHAHNAIATAFIGGIIIAIFGNIFCMPVLKLINTPPEIIRYSEKYLRIYFAGCPFVLLYNFGSAIMRTMGDTKRPLIYLTVGGLANVILNIVLVLVFGMDADGVAIATIVSNAISAAFVLYNLSHSHHDCRIFFSEIKLRKKEFRAIMGLGLPTGIQSAMFSVSNLVMQSSINSFGSAFVAGNAAGANIDHYTNFVGDSFVQAALTFSGQNFGAKNHRRIKKVFTESMLSVFLVSLALSLAIIAFRYPLTKIFIVDNPYAIEVSSQRLILVAGFYCFCGTMGVASANIRAIGKSVVPMAVTIFGVCIVRIIWVYTVLEKFHYEMVLYAIYPLTWISTSLIHLITFIYFYKKMKNGKMKMGV